jgi:hypothetical protein
LTGQESQTDHFDFVLRMKQRGRQWNKKEKWEEKEGDINLYLFPGAAVSHSLFVIVLLPPTLMQDRLFPCNLNPCDFNMLHLSSDASVFSCLEATAAPTTNCVLTCKSRSVQWLMDYGLILVLLHGSKIQFI